MDLEKVTAHSNSLIVMLDKWRKALDNGKTCRRLINLMIAKLHAYGFDYNSLAYILQLSLKQTHIG